MNDDFIIFLISFIIYSIGCLKYLIRTRTFFIYIGMKIKEATKFEFFCMFIGMIGIFISIL